ncbi:hypothetical protein IFM89_020127 [Coptis chinensis]|uniref:Uncharacterized protein n=1 Tax=Coptis chinensis TaxID=261450 RepID=A0A835IBD7_9MAGN|nr:hypothetical protein IFM89_020127 [Coptis chinensis]
MWMISCSSQVDAITLLVGGMIFSEVYSVGVSVFLGGNKPSRNGDVRSDLCVTFSCDLDISWKLVDIVLNEISCRQEERPSEQDVSTILGIEQQAHENDLQVSSVMTLFPLLSMLSPLKLTKTITGLIGFSAATSHDCIMVMSVLRSRLVVCN